MSIETMNMNNMLAQQMRLEYVGRGIESFIEKEGYFTGRNVTEYLKKYEAKTRILLFTDEEKRERFSISTHIDYAEGVETLQQQSSSWSEMKAALRAKYRSQDSTRMSTTQFVTWINTPKHELPSDILQAFNLKFSELDIREQATFTVGKTHWILQALPEKYRPGLIEHLRENEELTSNEEKVKEQIDNLSANIRLQQRELSGSTTERVIMSSVVKPEAAEHPQNMSDLLKAFEQFSVNVMSVIHPKPVNNANPIITNRGMTRCIWCDHTGHRKRECRDLGDAIRAGVVMVDNGIILRSRDRSRITIPPIGGLRSTILSEQQNNNVAVNSIRLEEANAYAQTVFVDEKRAYDNKDQTMEPRTKKSRISTPENASNDVRRSQRGIQRNNEQTQKTSHVPETKPSYGVRAKVQKGDPIQTATAAVLGAKVELDVGALASILPGPLLRAVSENFRARRVDAQVASSTADGETEIKWVAECNAMSIDNLKFVPTRPMMPSTIPTQPQWAWACPQVSVFIPALGKSVEALIDSGSEITVIDHSLIANSNITCEPEPNWNMRTATGRVQLRGACPNVLLMVGDIGHHTHIFSQEGLGHQLILGQTWRVATRMGSHCLPDGSELAYIYSDDGKKARCWIATKANDSRNNRDRKPHVEKPTKAWSTDLELSYGPGFVSEGYLNEAIDEEDAEVDF